MNVKKWTLLKEIWGKPPSYKKWKRRQTGTTTTTKKRWTTFFFLFERMEWRAHNNNRKTVDLLIQHLIFHFSYLTTRKGRTEQTKQRGNVFVSEWERARERERESRSIPDVLFFTIIEHEQKTPRIATKQAHARNTKKSTHWQHHYSCIQFVHRIIFAFKICLLHIIFVLFFRFLFLSLSQWLLVLWRTLKRNIRLVFRIL